MRGSKVQGRAEHCQPDGLPIYEDLHDVILAEPPQAIVSQDAGKINLPRALIINQNECKQTRKSMESLSIPGFQRGKPNGMYAYFYSS